MDKNRAVKRAICVVLTGIIVFCSGYFLGALTNSVTATIYKPVTAAANAEVTTTATPETTTVTATIPPTTTAPTTEPTTETTTTAPSTEATTQPATQDENQTTQERVFNCSFIEIKVNILESIRDLLNIDFVTSVIDAIVSFCMTVDSLFA